MRASRRAPLLSESQPERHLSGTADAPAMVVKQIATTEEIISKLRSTGKLARPGGRVIAEPARAGCTRRRIHAGDDTAQPADQAERRKQCDAGNNQGECGHHGY